MTPDHAAQAARAQHIKELRKLSQVMRECEQGQLVCPVYLTRIEAIEAGLAALEEAGVKEPESVFVQHARKQGAADGFQHGWHAALQRLREGDTVDDLAALVPDTHAGETIPPDKADLLREIDRQHAAESAPPATATGVGTRPHGRRDARTPRRRP